MERTGHLFPLPISDSLKQPKSTPRHQHAGRAEPEARTVLHPVTAANPKRGKTAEQNNSIACGFAHDGDVAASPAFTALAGPGRASAWRVSMQPFHHFARDDAQSINDDGQAGFPNPTARAQRHGRGGPRTGTKHQPLKSWTACSAGLLERLGGTPRSTTMPVPDLDDF